MFPSRYFPDRYFAPRYFPKVGAAAPVVTDDTQISHFLQHRKAHIPKSHLPESEAHIGQVMPFWVYGGLSYGSV